MRVETVFIHDSQATVDTSAKKKRGLSALEEEIVIGVLAIQGDFEKHIAALARIDGAKAVRVRFPDDIDKLDGMIIPGGESTTFTIHFDRWGFRGRVAEFIASGRPVWGTCAGAIMLASRGLDNDEQVDVRPLGAVDIAVVRNGYGRQVNSFETPVTLELDGAEKSGIIFSGVFIRAPRFTELGDAARISGRFGDEPVMIEQGSVLVTSFHPELTGDDRVHRYFAGKVRARLESIK